MALVVQDTFAGTPAVAITSRAGEVGATWTRHPSYSTDFSISSLNRARSAVLSADYASGVPASAEYDVQADFVMVDSATNSTVGICGRMDTAANTFYHVRYN